MRIGVMLLAVTGCKIQVQSAAPAGTSDDASGAAVTGATSISRAGSLTIEPSEGYSPVYNLIGRARHSINVTMYEFSDTTAERDLGAARRGVRVRVILDHRTKSVNADAYSYFRSHGVKVTWSSSHYRYTHQKTVIADELCVLIALRDALHRREVYVQGAGRWKDPDEDLPGDFEDNRDVPMPSSASPLTLMTAYRGAGRPSLPEDLAKGRLRRTTRPVRR